MGQIRRENGREAVFTRTVPLIRLPEPDQAEVGISAALVTIGENDFKLPAPGPVSGRLAQFITN